MSMLKLFGAWVMLRDVPKDKTNLARGVGSAYLSGILMEIRHEDYVTWIQMRISKAEMLSFRKVYFPSRRKRISIQSKMEAIGH